MMMMEILVMMQRRWWWWGDDDDGNDDDDDDDSDNDYTLMIMMMMMMMMMMILHTRFYCSTYHHRTPLTEHPNPLYRTYSRCITELDVMWVQTWPNSANMMTVESYNETEKMLQATTNVSHRQTSISYKLQLIDDNYNCCSHHAFIFIPPLRVTGR